MRASEIDGGTFGTNTVGDYCELVTVLFGGDRIAMIYRDTNSYFLWLYGPNEMAGTSRSLTASLDARVALRVSWTETDVEASVDRLTGSQPPSFVLQRPLSPGAASRPVTVRAGHRCVGQTPDVELVVDDLEVRSIP